MLSSALGLVRQPYYRTIYDKAGAWIRDHAYPLRKDPVAALTQGYEYDAANRGRAE